MRLRAEDHGTVDAGVTVILQVNDHQYEWSKKWFYFADSILF